MLVDAAWATSRPVTSRRRSCAVHPRKPLANYGGRSATRSTPIGQSFTTCAVLGRNGVPNIRSFSRPRSALTHSMQLRTFDQGRPPEAAKSGLTMTAERANDPALNRQLCPSCTQPMRLVRRTPRFGGLPALTTFECEIRCGLSHIGEDARPRTEMRKALAPPRAGGPGNAPSQPKHCPLFHLRSASHLEPQP